MSRTRRPKRLARETLRALAEQFAATTFAGNNPAYNAGRADGVTRGLCVFQISDWQWLPDGQLALAMAPGFQPIDGVRAVFQSIIGQLDVLMVQLTTYDPDHEIVLLIITPTEARSFRLGRNESIAVTA